MAHSTFKRLIVLAFLIIALPTGVLMAVLTPPGQVPDEQAHLARALSLLHGAVLAQRLPAMDGFTHRPVMRTGFMVDAGMVQLLAPPMKGSTVTAQDYYEIRNAAPDHRLVYIDAPNTATYFPAAYLPATAALAIGFAAHASPYICLLLARLAMLGAFLLLGALALAFTTYGEAVLLTILLLPMTLFLAGSVSQEAVIIALACLSCALLTRGTAASWRAALLVFLAILLAKPPYAPLLLVFLLPLSRATFRPRLGGVALACVPLLIWIGLVIAFVAVPYPIPPYHPGPLYHGNPAIWRDHGDAAANLHILLRHPARFAIFPWRTLQIYHSGLLLELIGVLGLLNIGLPMDYYYAWGGCAAFALAGLLLCKRGEAPRPRDAALNALIAWAAILGAAWAVIIVFYVCFTNAGWLYATGLQGRYFLLPLPFLLFAVPSLRTRLSPLIPALPVLALGLYDMGFLPLTIARFFYLH